MANNIKHRICGSCGKTFSKPYNVSVGTWEKRKYCSIVCRGRGLAKHGQAWKTPEYYIWQAMVQRCTNSAHPSYHKYGGRGIVVCNRWRAYEAFISDMGKRPSPDHSIDRKDNDGNYEPGNCRWATLVEQANNTRANRILEIDGVSETIADWSRKCGVKPNTIVTRLRAGWSPQRAIAEPTNEKFRTSRAHQ